MSINDKIFIAQAGAGTYLGVYMINAYTGQPRGAFDIVFAINDSTDTKALIAKLKARARDYMETIKPLNVKRAALACDSANARRRAALRKWQETRDKLQNSI